MKNPLFSLALSFGGYVVAKQYRQRQLDELAILLGRAESSGDTQAFNRVYVNRQRFERATALLPSAAAAVGFIVPGMIGRRR